MFFDSIAEIESIAGKGGTTIFVVPKDVGVKINGSLILKPEDKSVITIEQVRSVLERTNVKQDKDMFILIRPAELMNEAAANAFLKNLEEPNEKIHYVLVTDSPSRILPTILSRARLYFLRDEDKIGGAVVADEKDKLLAKKLLAAKPADLVSLVEEITKKKEGVRSYALLILGLAIEMMYKSYFLNGKEVFLKKIPKFLAAYDGVARNGHVKLQIISNLC